MSRWAKIQIIDKLSRGKLKDVAFTKVAGVYVESLEFGNSRGYYVYVVRPVHEITEELWLNIEEELLKCGIMYAAFEDESQRYPFKKIQKVTGEDVRLVLAPHLVRYIFKYRLTKDNEERATVGVIAGKINITLELLREISDVAKNIVLFVRNPEIYEGPIETLNKERKNKIRMMYPNGRAFRQMQVILDVNLYKSYVNLCDMRTIYIDLNKNTDNKLAIRQKGKNPIIWQEFEVLFEKRSVAFDVLQLAYYSMGFKKSMLVRQIKKHDIQITRVYKL